MHILMVAAENDALPGGKVGGLGDVVRDLPLALADLGHQVSIISPGYGTLAASERATLLTQFSAPFAGKPEALELYKVASPKVSHPNVRHLILEHWLFSAGGPGVIYCDDNYGPFATDAHKFALFCSAVCETLIQKIITGIDVIHCHDWHAATVLILRQYAGAYKQLKTLRTAFSIHNLSIQGVRPLNGDDSSLEGWFPGLQYDTGKIGDPYSRDCVNFMRAGITLADKVNTVSPTYAEEILKPSQWDHGIVGGEGLENDLNSAKLQGRLFGILNGCDYSTPLPVPDKRTLISLIDTCLVQWAVPSRKLSASYYFVLRRLETWKKKRKAYAPVLLSIGRMTYQKLGLFIADYEQHSVLEAILQELKGGLFIVAGSGDREYDQFFTRCMAEHDNFLYLCGYSDELARALYAYADMFIMPSIYEPCGISQMLAMRGGMPCIAHATGGLRDTVIDGKNGFTFSGDTIDEKAAHFIETTGRALALFRQQSDEWKSLQEGARSAHFSWETAARQYEALLYRASDKGKHKISLV